MPKKLVVLPAASTSMSYGSAPTLVSTRRPGTSMPVTSAMSTSTLCARRSTVRIGWAISDGSSKPDATWYSSGWNR